MNRTIFAVGAAMLISGASVADGHGAMVVDAHCLTGKGGTAPDAAFTLEEIADCASAQSAQAIAKYPRKRPPYLIVTTYNTVNGNDAGRALIYLDKVAYFLRDGDKNATHIVFADTRDSFSIRHQICQVEEAIVRGKRWLEPFKEPGDECVPKFD